MGKYIEQLKNLKTRGEGAAKPTEPPKSEEVMTVLSPGRPLVSKISKLQKHISECNTTHEYFAVMRAWRATAPDNEEIYEVYSVAREKLRILNNPQAGYQPVGVTVASMAALTTPLSPRQAMAIRRKYRDDLDLWRAFRDWAGMQIEAGATAKVIELSEMRLFEACSQSETENY